MARQARPPTAPAMTRYQITLEAGHLPRPPLLWARPKPPGSVGGAASAGAVHAEVWSGTTAAAAAGAATLLLGRTEEAVPERHGRHRRVQWLRPVLADVAPSSLAAPLTVRVRSHDGATLGEVTVEPPAVLRSPGRVRVATAASGITVTVSLEESRRGGAAGTLRLRLRGLDVKNVEPGPLGLGRSDPGFEIAKKALDAGAGVVRWIPVYRSEFVMNHLNPFWEEFALDLEALCYGDLDWPLRIRVQDFQRSGRHRLIGAVEATPRLLLANAAVRGNADRRRAFELLRAGRDGEADLHAARGLLVVVTAELVAAAAAATEPAVTATMMQGLRPPYVERGPTSWTVPAPPG